MAVICQLLLLTLVMIQSVNQVAGEHFNLKEDLATYFENDYSVHSEKKSVGDFHYQIHNFTFSANSGDQTDRVKRDLTSGGRLLCVMTFNIKTYAAPQGAAREKDMVIPRVSL